MTRVGVLLPVRNGLSTIETALGALADQTHRDTRVYITDDASDDGTTQFLLDRPDWYQHLAILSERRGWPAALNTAAAMAMVDGCEHLFVTNADDILRLDCVEECSRELDRSPGLSFTVPLVQQIGGENVVQRSLPKATIADFAVSTPIVAFCMIRTSTWRAVDGYATDVNLPPDAAGNDPMAGHNELDFYLRLVKKGHRYSVLEGMRPLVYYRMHSGQLHRQVVARSDEALELIYRKHPDIPASVIQKGTPDD